MFFFSVPVLTVLTFDPGMYKENIYRCYILYLFFTLAIQGEGWDPINRFNPAAFSAPVPSQESNHCASCVFSPLYKCVGACSEIYLFTLLSHTIYIEANCSLSSGVVFCRALKTIGWEWVAVFISGRMVVSWMCSPFLLFILCTYYYSRVFIEFH